MEDARTTRAGEGRFWLDGKVALVTGAGRGLGRAVAIAFAGCGARVACLDRDPAGVRATAEAVLAAEQAAGRAGDPAPAIAALIGDVTSAESVAAAAEQVVAATGRIDVLVTCARITSRIPATEFPEERWRAIVDVNLTGVFLACQTVGRQMVRQRSGSIVNLASIAALGGLGRGNTAYSASKGGVVALTRELAIEWAPYGVRVNAVAPCQIRSPVVEPLLADPALAADLVGRIPLGRIAEPDDVVGPVIFLASDAARMITGHVLAVDGGYSAQ